MTAEWVTAIGSIGTFIVIAATAVAALVQLRHMRSSNQIASLSEFRETLETEFFRESEEYVMQKLPAILNDPRIRAQIAEGRDLTGIKELVPVRTLADFFEMGGAFVKAGVVDRELACDLWGLVVLAHWNAIAPVVANVRAVRNNTAIWENFEYWAAASRAFARKHADGTYPKRAARETLPALWPEVIAAVKRREEPAN